MIEHDIHSEDYYKILGVNKESNIDEIKKNYRKLSLLYHPDKNPENTDQFKKISEAYSTLVDPNKKYEYDNKGNIQNLFNFDNFNNLDIFKNLFGFGESNNNFNNFKNRIFKTETIQIELTLEEIYFGKQINKTLNIHKLCDTCNGEMFTKFENCNTCGGNGKIVTNRQFGPMMTQIISDCMNCRGKCKIGCEVCGKCKGKGITTYIEDITLNINKGIKHNDKFEHNINNNIFIFIIHQLSHPLYSRENNDLILKMKIPLVEALCGIEFKLKLLSGEEIIIKKEDEVIEYNKKYVLKELGIPNSEGLFGDLIIYFDISLPKKMTNEEKIDIYKVFGTNKKEFDKKDNKIINL